MQLLCAKQMLRISKIAFHIVRIDTLWFGHLVPYVPKQRSVSFKLILIPLALHKRYTKICVFTYYGNVFYIVVYFKMDYIPSGEI